MPPSPSHFPSAPQGNKRQRFVMPGSPIRDAGHARGAAEYDMDSDDEEWLAEYNYTRTQSSPLKAPQFERAMSALLSGTERLAKPIGCVGEHSKRVRKYFEARVAQQGRAYLLPLLQFGSGNPANETHLDNVGNMTDGPYACFAPYDEEEEPMARQAPSMHLDGGDDKPLLASSPPPAQRRGKRPRGAATDARALATDTQSDKGEDESKGEGEGEREGEDADADADEEEDCSPPTWDVDRILDTRVAQGRVRQWHVQWTTGEKTWEPKESFVDGNTQFNTFEALRTRRSKPSARRHTATTGQENATRPKKKTTPRVKTHAANTSGARSLRRQKSTDKKGTTRRTRHLAMAARGPSTTRRMALAQVQFN